MPSRWVQAAADVTEVDSTQGIFEGLRACSSREAADAADRVRGLSTTFESRMAAVTAAATALDQERRELIQPAVIDPSLVRERDELRTVDQPAHAWPAMRPCLHCPTAPHASQSP
jgi:hypothetical protein